MRHLTSDQHLSVPAVDLAQTPISETVVMLRSLGQSLLTNAITEVSPPPLLELLSGYREPLMRQWTLCRSRQRQRRIGCNAGRLLGTLVKLTVEDAVLQARSTSYERTFRLGLAGTISQAGWYVRLENELEQQLEIVKPPFVASDFWTLLGVTAWSDLSYQRSIVTQLWDHFRPRVLCSPADFALATLAPNTFWALIGLSMPGTLSGIQKLVRNRRLLNEAIQCLQIAATRQALVADWAAFWDQWVLARALETWTRKTTVPEAPLLQAVRNLPLVTPDAITLEAPEMAVPVRLSRQSWEQDAPSWYQSWRAIHGN